MKFDSKRNIFINRGQTLSPQQVRDTIERELIEPEKQEVEREANKVLRGAITLAAFFAFLREKIHHWHGIAATVAYGGESRMNSERWKRVDKIVTSQLDYLDKWQTAAEKGERLTGALVRKIADLPKIPAGLDAVVEREVESALMLSDAAGRVQAIRTAVTEAVSDSVEQEVAAEIAGEAVGVVEAAETSEIIWASLPSRGTLYADATYATFENSVKQREFDSGAVGVRRVCVDDDASCEECPSLATEEYVGLDEITDVGDTICQTRCRCFFEYSHLGVEPLIIEESFA